MTHPRLAKLRSEIDLIVKEESQRLQDMFADLAVLTQAIKDDSAFPAGIREEARQVFEALDAADKRIQKLLTPST